MPRIRKTQSTFVEQLYISIIGHQNVIKVSEPRLSTFLIEFHLLWWHDIWFNYDISQLFIGIWVKDHTKPSSWVDKIDTMNAMDCISFHSKFYLLFCRLIVNPTWVWINNSKQNEFQEEILTINKRILSNF